MNDFQRYLLDEFVEDYRAGEMSRRDFVMKSIGVCGSLAAAMGLFSSVGLSEAEIAAAQAAPRFAQPGPNPVTVSPADPDISVADVEFPTADGSTLLGYLAMPSMRGTFAGIVVIHENRALLEHHKDIVRRYAKAGFAAVAPDLVSREGGTDTVNPDDVPGLLSKAEPQRHVEDATAAGAFIRAQDGVRSDVHGITGSAPAVMAALETAGVPHDFKVYSGANHAFFNDTGPRYDKAAATDAWARAVSWFREYVPASM
jgi:carboxymethylenebutenolidase